MPLPTGGLAYAVMEFLDGDNLREKLRQGPLPIKRALEIAIEMAHGLGTAHERGIVHRDVKPENLFISRDGRVKVLDFGLAKQTFVSTTSPADVTMAGTFLPLATEAGVVMGTVGYMSPEQVRGEVVDPRSDIFSFGVVLFEMLTGQRPFKGDTPVQTMAAILDLEPPSLVSTRGPLPPALERIVAHCLEKRPEARFHSMKDVAFALESLGTATSAFTVQVRPRKVRATAPLIAAAAVAGTLALGLLFGLLGLPPFAPGAMPTFARLTFTPGTVEAARFGPDGKTIYYDRAGKRTVLFSKLGDANGDTITGMAWGPDGSLWYSELIGDQTALWAQPRGGGRRRLLWRAEGTKALMDVSPEGRVLLANHQVRRGVLVQRAGAATVQEVSVASGSQAEGLSADGTSLLIMESPILDGGTPLDRAFISHLDGRPPLKVAKGTPWSFSADGQWLQMQYSGFEPKDLDPAVTSAFQQAGLDPKAVLDPASPAPCILFVPSGAGHPFAVALPKGMEGVGYAFLHPDGRRIIFNSGEGGHSAWYGVDRKGGVPRALTPPGYGKRFVGLYPLSPDGERLLVVEGTHFFVQPLKGGAPQPIQAIRKDERPLGWGPGGTSVYIRSEQWVLPLEVTRLDLATGARRKMFEFMPGDPSGILMMRSVFLPPDGKLCVLDYVRQLSELYVVDGVR